MEENLDGRIAHFQNALKIARSKRRALDFKAALLPYVCFPCAIVLVGAGAYGIAGPNVGDFWHWLHLVYGRVALFIQVGWGGAYIKEGKQEQMIVEAFARCGEVLEAAAGVDVFERGRLVIAQSDFRGINVCSWLSEPTEDVETAGRWLRERARPDRPAPRLGTCVAA